MSPWRPRLRWVLASLALHGVLGLALLRPWAPKPGPTAGEEGAGALAAGVEFPPALDGAEPEEPIVEPPLDDPEPPRIEAPRWDPPESPLPVEEVTELPLGPSPLPLALPPARPFALPDRRPAPPLPVRAPAPSAPALPATGRVALEERERPDPPRPPGVPADLDLELQLEYTVDADGGVRDARVVRSSGWPVLDESTREFVVRRWRYAPPGEARRVTRRVRFRAES